MLLTANGAFFGARTPCTTTSCIACAVSVSTGPAACCACVAAALISAAEANTIFFIGLLPYKKEQIRGMFPYDGITRIRFLGYVLSPPNLASTP